MNLGIESKRLNQSPSATEFLVQQKRWVDAVARQFSTLDDYFKQVFDGVAEQVAPEGFADLKLLHKTVNGRSRDRRTSPELLWLVVVFPELAELDLAIESKLNTLQSWLVGMSHLEGEQHCHELYSTWSHVERSFQEFTVASQRFIDAAESAH